MHTIQILAKWITRYTLATTSSAAVSFDELLVRLHGIDATPDHGANVIEARSDRLIGQRVDHRLVAARAYGLAYHQKEPTSDRE